MLGLLIRENYLIAGVLISSISFFLGFFFFKNYLQLITKNYKKMPVWRWSQLLLLTFSTSFFFITIYTEATFFLLFMAALYFIKKHSYFIAATLAFFVSLTRIVGVFIFIPILLSFFAVSSKSSKTSQSLLPMEKLKWLVLMLSPFFGLGSYSFYLWKTTGDPLYFLNSQSEFGANRSSHFILFPQVIYRYVRIFMMAQQNFTYFISLMELVIFGFILTILLADLISIIKKHDDHFYDRLSLNIFSFVNILLPTFTGTLSSIPRYSLMSFSFFIFLAEIKNNYTKATLFVLFAILHIFLFGFFIQGYFVS